MILFCRISPYGFISHVSRGISWFSMSSRDRLEVLLKEWELCHHNLKRHNDWLWQTGSIFIVMSLAALWALSQIDEPSNKQWFFVFCGFSTSTIAIWYIFIVRRVMLWFDTTVQQILRIEKELRDLTWLQRDFLHTIQRGKIKGARFKARYVVHFFCHLSYMYMGYDVVHSLCLNVRLEKALVCNSWGLKPQNAL